MFDINPSAVSMLTFVEYLCDPTTCAVAKVDVAKTCTKHVKAFTEHW